MTMPIVCVQNVTRRYGKFAAVNDISFSVHDREIFGFLGPNGAGKSTTIKMMCTLLSPTSGCITVAGYDVSTQADSVRANIGIVFQDTSLDSGLTAQENLEFHCMMYHIPRGERPQRIANVLELLDLTEHRRRIVKTYSGGMRRRLEIARGLLHEPNLLVLDEPTVGLDPQTRNYIWLYVRELRERRGTTIFMTTHYMDEAENCDRIAIIDKGVIVALDTPIGLKKLVGEDRVELVTADNERTGKLLKDEFGVTGHIQDSKLTFQVESADRFTPRLIAIMAQSENPIAIESLNIRPPTLEDVFLKLTGHTIREEEGTKDEGRLTMRRRGKI